ncbi:penicillin-binding transpeptidase domain-containing protein [Peptoniphilus harei]|uniref:penicillin-binding transpeptidase domain-containing protein n=1 Tax=Peptoniphilus harei TaxID=54005 RepID=UPI00254BA9B6|nr:penicillin-binding transpeptidase domain-containing protein [Peptoniphilus harei]MDK7355121.1 penicillin-binding transpeptidase domain-containing protein [Peptoniphilus harei]MDK7370767.1 penicillin-binding transpeptidase domain-containing protein [Peptoniphilus harei]
MKTNKVKARDKKMKNGFKSKTNNANRFIFVFFIFLAFLFVILIAKLLWIQIVQSEELTIAALNQLTKTEVINSNRGIIYDRNKKEMAINITKCNVFYDMDYLKERKDESESDFKNRKEKLYDEDAKTISDVTGIDYDEIRSKMEGDKVVRLATNIERGKAQELKDLRLQIIKENKEKKDNKKSNLIPMSIDDVTRRLYPFNNLASYVIGFTNDENVGQYGIEASFDEELSGISGKNVSLKDNASNKIPLTDEETYAPKEGYSVVLSIDSNIQQFAETAALHAKKENMADKVSIIVQDTMTGEILAMTTKDDYNLNDPRAPLNEKQEEEWDKLSEEEKMDILYDNWRDFNVNDQYEPGSIFKLITAAAAIEENTAQPDSQYVCNGAMVMGNSRLTCTSRTRGKKTLAKGIEESCNMTMIQVGQDLGAEKFLKYIKAFGFGKKTGIELYGESIGIVPRSYKDISKVNLATMSYGHSIAVSPIQLINAVSAISNGGFLNKPTLIKEIVDANGNVIERKRPELRRRVISEETSDKMKMMMRRVVEKGTGQRAQVPGYIVGGKSGTANIATPTGYLEAYNSSFVGVAPLNDPRLTVLVVINNPKGGILGSVVAAPVVQDVLEKSLNYMKIQKTEEVDEKDEFISVPNVGGLLLEDAGKILIDSGLRFNNNSENVLPYSVVTNQSPSAGSYVLKDTIIDLAVNDKDSGILIMPDLSKKTRKESQSILNSMNLEYNIKGNGDFISQSPRPGQKLSGSESVTLNYSKKDEDFDKPSEENSNNKSFNEGKNYNSEKKSEVNKKNKENNKEIKKSKSKKKKSKENLENNNKESNKNKRD